MPIRLVDHGWAREIEIAVAADSNELKIISPFIKTAALTRFLSVDSEDVKVITRFNLADFASGVSDIAALRRLLRAGASVRGVRNLHSKLYVFGSSRAIVTSANLTESALNRNHEFGFVSQDAAIVATCLTYFGDMWTRAGSDLNWAMVDRWEEIVTRHRASGDWLRPTTGLEDYGADAGQIGPAPSSPSMVGDAPQAFVKFLGESGNRVPLSCEILEEIERAGCHSELAYPSAKRPRSVQDGAVMFIGRMTAEPDIRIFGRAIAMQHVPGRDDATPEDVARRDWRATWSRYIRVHHAEFVAGTMANGISLNELMVQLGPNAFAPTQRNAMTGVGNTNPRRAYRQQAAVQLSSEGFSWISERLQSAFASYGKLPKETLARVDR